MFKKVGFVGQLLHPRYINIQTIKCPKMVVAQLFGFVLLLSASVSSSVSMNFQKLAQYETEYQDPRNRLLKRKSPLETPVCLRPLFCVALILSAAASMLDFVALAWLPTAVIGVFGSMSIIINLCVTRIILFEAPSKEEGMAILYVIVGCLLAITTTSENVSELSPPQLLERPLSCVYIVLNWVLFVLTSVFLDNVTVTPWISQVGFPFIGGALGAQNVCMGKYIAYAVVSAHEAGELTVRVDVLISTLLLCVASVIVHIVWLNKGLEKYDAYYCIIVYQSAWFIFTTLSGIVVYDNMATVTGMGWLFFTTGLASIVFGVWKVSVLHLDKP